MTLKVKVHKAEEGGFWAEVPSLPGCLSQGESFEETVSNIREAADLYLEVLTDVEKSLISQSSLKTSNLVLDFN